MFASSTQIAQYLQQYQQNILYFHYLSVLACNPQVKIASFPVEKKLAFSGSLNHDGKGRWTDRQQQCYIQFITENESEMREKTLRKSKKVFLKMSKVVMSRNPDQCRSHHQKVLKIHKSLSKFIQDHSDKKKSKKTQVPRADQTKISKIATTYETDCNSLYSLTKKQNHFRFQIDPSKISYF